MKAVRPKGSSLIALALCVAPWVPATGLAQMVQSDQTGTYGSPLDGSASGARTTSTQSQSIANGTMMGTDGLGNQIIQPKTVTGSDGSQETLLEKLLLGNKNQLDSDAGKLLKTPPPPGEFETYVSRLLGRKLKRYGADLLLPSARDFVQPATATVPPAYIIQPGDTVVISLSGSIEGSVQRQVDTNGKIFLEGVGAIRVAGVRNSDLHDVISAAIGRQYRGYTVSTRVADLGGLHVYVTGFANNPGAFTVSSLATLTNVVLQAGGPSSGGSFRSVKVYRNGHEVGDFDLYTLLRAGNRRDDPVLQNEDVIFIPPAGDQVAVVGSVQDEAIYELKPGETAVDALRAAGGPNTLADKGRVVLYRVTGDEPYGPRQLSMADASRTFMKGGDILQVLSQGSLAQPTDRQSVMVRIEGEVRNPGNYYVSPNTSANEVIAMAGGLTSSAYVYGTRLTRQSVRLQQMESFKEAISQFELTLAAAPLTNGTTLAEADRAHQIESAKQVLDKMRKAEPDGRLVLDLNTGSTTLPSNLKLENNDAIYIPRRVDTVGVFGAVYRPASFLLDSSHPLRVRDVVESSGGTMRSADRGNIFVLHVNGEVVSHRRDAMSSRVLPGDVVFVPVKTQGSSTWAKIKDITTTLFAMGVTAAAIWTVTK